ncbi:MAG: alpha/beta hydrolase [Pelosinus sp.]|nr:alpha/beta hydrolase [Pelosinus sp.]
MKEHVWINSRNKRLSAMLHIPEEFNSGTPLIVCCHGFTGNKVGYNHLTLNLANFLAEKGYGVLRFDFLGSGDSEGEFSTDTVVSGWRQDLKSVLAWVNANKQFAKSPIILYGHSLGGLIVLSHEDPRNEIAARMVFAPVTQPISNFRDVILGPELWAKSLAGEPIENFFDKGFTLKSQFVRDLVKNDYQPVLSAGKIATPLLIVHGTADAVVPIQGSRELAERYQGQKEFAVTDFDHGALGAQKKLQMTIWEWLKGMFCA